MTVLASKTTNLEPDLSPGYVSTQIGEMVTVITSRPVVLGQNLGDVENAVEPPADADFTLFADRVTLSGQMNASGRNILIIAREVDTADDQVKISVSGVAGHDVLPDKYASAASAGKEGRQSGRGDTGRGGDDGGRGDDGADGADGTAGGAGGAAGSITIYCQRANSPFSLDATGGRGGNAQSGQDGGDGGPGGRGFDAIKGPGPTFATRGGPGGLAGRGGAGALASQPGAGGTIEFAAADPDSARPSADNNSVGTGAPGKPGLPGNPGKPGAGGPGGSGTHDTATYWFPSDDYSKRYYDGADKGADGQTDGVTDGTTTFRAASAKYVAGDVGRLLVIEGRDFYGIEEVTNGTTLRLSDNAPAAGGQKWSLITVKPWKVSTTQTWIVDRASYYNGTADGTNRFQGHALSSVIDAFYIQNRGFYWNTDYITPVYVSGYYSLDREVDAGSGLSWVPLALTKDVPNPLKGSANVATGPDAGATVRAAALVSEEYFYMQADRARFVYLSADPVNNPDAYGEIYERLEWVLNLLAVPISDGSKMDRLTPLYGELDAMLTGLSSGLDYFGHNPTWAPPLTYDYYADLLPAAIDGLAQAEADEANNRQKAVALLQKGATLKELAAGALADRARLEQQAKDANAVLLKLTGALTDQDAKIATTKEALKSAINDWMNKQRQTVDWMQGVDIAMQLFEAVTQIAFLPEDPAAGGMATLKSLSLIGGNIGKAGAGIGKSAMADTGAQITGDDGQRVSVKYELKGLRSFGESADDMRNGMTTLPKGVLQPDTTNEMLVGPTKALKDLLDEFSDAGGDEAKTTRQAMDDYTDAVVTRNATILQYNQALVNLRTAQQRIKAANALYAQAQNQKAQVSTMGLAEHLVDRAVDRARLYCLEVLYLMGRAYRMFTLKENDEFYDALGLSQAWEFDSQVARSVKTSLTDNWTNAYASAYSANARPNFNEVEDFRQPGISWRFKEADFPDLFAALRATGKGTIKLPPSHRTHATGPFAHMANIRLRLVRCWLEGAESSSGLMKLSLIHRGDDTFVRPDDEEVPITHDPTEIPFWYRTEPGEVGTWKAVTKNRNPEPDERVPVDGYVHVKDKKLLVSMGPFATWEIQLLDVTERSPDDPVAIDLSKCNRITFEFFVFFQPFS